MKILRQEKDVELKTYCYLIDIYNKLYFLHACERLPLLTDNQFESYIKENQDSTELVSVEDVETINYYYHVAFEDENQLIKELLKLKKEIFIDLFFLYSIENMEHIDSRENYLRKCIIFHQLFGNTYTERLLNNPKLKDIDFKKDFIYSDNEGDEAYVNGDKIDFYTFSNIYEYEISDIITFGSKQSFRDVLFNTSCSGIITNDFLFNVMSRDEFGEKISLFYRNEQFYNNKSVALKLLVAERKWKIEILLNPNFLIKNSKIKNA